MSFLDSALSLITLASLSFIGPADRLCAGVLLQLAELAGADPASRPRHLHDGRGVGDDRGLWAPVGTKTRRRLLGTVQFRNCSPRASFVRPWPVRIRPPSEKVKRKAPQVARIRWVGHLEKSSCSEIGTSVPSGDCLCEVTEMTCPST